jgi:CheY-like chemotaxis protein
MLRVRIVHWKASEAGPLLDTCRGAGFQVDYAETDLPATARALREAPPDVLVIDLSRMPSHGRELAIWFRKTKRTRQIPIVFAGGAPEKVAALQQLLSDAVFSTLERLVADIRHAHRHPVQNPATPPTVMERYGSRSNAQKLGVRPGSTVALYDAPRDYANIVGELPDEVELIEEPETVQAVTLWFVRDPRDYVNGLRRKRAIAGRTKLWVIWRKGSTNGLTGNLVREAANEAGLVDYKICSLDKQWSGMAFAVRKT